MFKESIPLKAASFCSLTAGVFSQQGCVQTSFVKSTCLKESQSTS